MVDCGETISSRCFLDLLNYFNKEEFKNLFEEKIKLDQVEMALNFERKMAQITVEYSTQRNEYSHLEVKHSKLKDKYSNLATKYFHLETSYSNLEIKFANGLTKARVEREIFNQEVQLMKQKHQLLLSERNALMRKIEELTQNNGQ